MSRPCTPPVDRECPCGVVFQVRYASDDKKYCTRECCYPPRKPNENCLNCGKKLPSVRKHGRRSYCNTSCANTKRWTDFRKERAAK